MTHPLHNHPHFTSWTDPQTGVESFVLTEHVAVTPVRAAAERMQ